MGGEAGPINNREEGELNNSGERRELGESLAKYEPVYVDLDEQRAKERGVAVQKIMEESLRNSSALLPLKKFVLFGEGETPRVDLPGVDQEVLYNEEAQAAMGKMFEELQTSSLIEMIEKAKTDKDTLKQLQIFAIRLLQNVGPKSADEWQEFQYSKFSPMAMFTRLAERLQLETRMIITENGLSSDQYADKTRDYVEGFLGANDISDEFRGRLEGFLPKSQEGEAVGTAKEVEDIDQGTDTSESGDVSGESVYPHLNTQEYLVGAGLEAGEMGGGDVGQYEAMVEEAEISQERETGEEVLVQVEVEADDFEQVLEDGEEEVEATGNVLQPVRTLKEQRKIVEQYAGEQQRINEIYVQAVDLRGGYEENLLTYLQVTGERACRGESGAEIRKLLGEKGAGQAMIRFFETLPNQMQRAIDVGHEGKESLFKASIKYVGRYMDRVGTHREIFGAWGAVKAAIPSWLSWPKWVAKLRRSADLNMLAVRERAIGVIEQAAGVAKEEPSVQDFLQSHAEELRLAQLVEEPRWRVYVGEEGAFLEVRALDAVAAQEKLQASRRVSVHKVEEVKKQQAGSWPRRQWRQFWHWISGK